MGYCPWGCKELDMTEALTGKNPSGRCSLPEAERLEGSGWGQNSYHYQGLVWKGEFGISFLVNCVLALLWDLGSRESNFGLSQNLSSDHRISQLAA